jgi:tetratricopeptide (TPR) repeat protein
MRRRLAQANPAAYEPDLALSLSNLSVRLAAVGRREEGLAAIQDAVEVRRRLAEARPHIFLADLAEALNNQSNALVQLGRVDEALASKNEAERLLPMLDR